MTSFIIHFLICNLLISGMIVILFAAKKNIEGSPDKQDTIQSVVPAAALLFPGTTPALIIYAESDSRYQRNTSGKDCALIKQ